MNADRDRRRLLRGTRDVASCLQATRALQRYLDGELDELSAQRVRRHLGVCRRCGLEADTYAEIKKAVARRAEDVPTQTVRRLEDFARDLATADRG